MVLVTHLLLLVSNALRDGRRDALAFFMKLLMGASALMMALAVAESADGASVCCGIVASLLLGHLGHGHSALYGCKSLRAQC